MRVVEQLIQHFWQRGALHRAEADYLVRHGFVQARDLPDYLETESTGEATPLYRERVRPESPPPADPEDELLGKRTGSKKRGGKKKLKAAGHNLAPLEQLLRDQAEVRQEYPALLELGQRIRPCQTWGEAAAAIASVTPLTLETHLVPLLNHRPPALGELWFWFYLEPLFDWTQVKSHAGPVASALARLLRAEVPTQVGRIEQLRKAAGMDDFLELLAARRVFFESLGGLYRRHFSRLKRWLVEPSGLAGMVWPALGWAYVLVYNARTEVPPGYTLTMSDSTLSRDLRTLAWEQAWRMASTQLLQLIPPLLHGAGGREFSQIDEFIQCDYICPFDWTL